MTQTTNKELMLHVLFTAFPTAVLSIVPRQRMYILHGATTVLRANKILIFKTLSLYSSNRCVDDKFCLCRISRECKRRTQSVFTLYTISYILVSEFQKCVSLFSCLCCGHLAPCLLRLQAQKGKVELNSLIGSWKPKIY